MKLVSVAVLTITLCAAQNIPVPAAGTAAIHVDEYNRLLELAGQAAKTPAAPPYPYVLKSAKMQLRVKGETVAGGIAIEGEVLTKNDSQVPLVSGLIVTEAKQNGRDLPLMQESGIHVAMLPGSSPFAVTLEAAAPLTVETGRASFNLPVPAAGAAELELTVPGDHTIVNLSAGLITRRYSHNGHTIVEATLPPGQTASLWWASRATPQAPPVVPKETRFLSDVKTLISVSEGELGVAALTEITVVQGDPAEFTLRIPEGYEVTGATGPTLASTDVQAGSVVLNVENPAARSHQFLVSYARANTALEAEIPLATFTGTQRETGELLIEGDGTLELSADERGGLRRMDLKETNPYLRSMAAATLQTSFRYQKRPSEMPGVALKWVRFPDSRVLSAVAQQAAVTTLVTPEGRSLTEVKLTVRNQAQPFLKVDLPADATILSADVAGEKVKPVTASDGNRVPLLRAGFRPSGAYEVSFVFLHAGTPFDKKGSAELTLPRMDVPVGRVTWEVFVPEQYRVSKFGGNATPEDWFPEIARDAYQAPPLSYNTSPSNSFGGRVLDPAGAVMPGATVMIRNTTTGAAWGASVDRNGNWSVRNMPAGQYEIAIDHPGFKSYRRQLTYRGSGGVSFDAVLELGTAAETITVTAEASLLKTESASVGTVVVNGGIGGVDELQVRTSGYRGEFGQASGNVVNVQQRVAGVLPIAVSVPRAGTSYRFLRPLVVSEETRLTFNYKRR